MSPPSPRLGGGFGARKWLITGATGQLGRLVVERLKPRARAVKVAARRLEDVAGFPAFGFDVTYLDYDLPASWERALDGVGALLLVPPTVDPHAYTRLAPFVDRAIQLGVRRVVLVSHLRAFAPHERALAQLERHVRTRAAEWTLLRPNWFLQDLATGFLGPLIRDHGVLAAPTGEGRATFVDARDVADVAVEALLRADLHGRALTLCGAHGLSFPALAALAGTVSGRRVRFLDLHEPVMRRQLPDADWPPARVELLLARLRDVREGHAEVFSDDIAQVLGRAPRGADAFVLEHADAWRPRPARRRTLAAP
jgi:uncharacterized protein YbjT (DUF2867 family)